MNPKLIVRYTVRETMGLVMMAVALFWSAGRLDWWQAWACLAVIAAWTAGTAVVILRNNPSLLAERLGPRKGSKSWDMTILGLMGVLQLARYILAGLDQRFGWTGTPPAAIFQVLALLLCASGYACMVWATAVNAFFSNIVRIQTERGHTVVTGGPYHFVRHPGYAGAILFELFSSLLLGSWAAFIPSVLGAGLLVLRTALEDKELQANLAGYPEYTRQVRYRLLPGVW